MQRSRDNAGSAFFCAIDTLSAAEFMSDIDVISRTMVNMIFFLLF
jgi:hypothetical protein